MSEDKTRILTGIRPTGSLHLGHYAGALENWLRLQDEYDCFFLIADYQVSDKADDSDSVREAVREIALDWLAVGLDPERSHFVIASLIPEHAELHLILSMVVPVPWLERNPTYKEKQQEIKSVDMSSYGFLGYPVLQTADIILYNAYYVPVGIDQVPHLELSREIVRRFNGLYKTKVFIEPAAKISDTPKLNGTDGRKMSKSYNNAIYLSDSEKDITKKIKSMLTDPQRARREDPGDPDVCNLYPFHKLYSPLDMQKEIDRDCRTAAIGCGDCKLKLTENVLAGMAPQMERRREISGKPKLVDEILAEGTKKAQRVARATLEKAKAAMKF